MIYYYGIKFNKMTYKGIKYDSETCHFCEKISQKVSERYSVDAGTIGTKSNTTSPISCNY